MNAPDTITAAWRALDRGHTRREQDAAWRYLCELRNRERDRFAASRGWVVCPWFATGRLVGARGRWVRELEGTEDAFDHRSCFTTPGRGGRPIAIVSHVYGDPAVCFRFAERYGLAVEQLESSWYLPQQCTAVLFQRPE